MYLTRIQNIDGTFEKIPHCRRRVKRRKIFIFVLYASCSSCLLLETNGTHTWRKLQSSKFCKNKTRFLPCKYRRSFLFSRQFVVVSDQRGGGMIVLRVMPYESKSHFASRKIRRSLHLCGREGGEGWKKYYKASKYIFFRGGYIAPQGGITEPKLTMRQLRELHIKEEEKRREKRLGRAWFNV